MKKQLIGIAIILFSLTAEATHIVGGGFRLNLIKGYNYKLEFNMYYDEVDAEPNLFNDDLVIKASIFEKGTNKVMQIVRLNRTSTNYFPYADTCMIAGLRTRLFAYSSDVFLDPLAYTSSSGYYIVWERCCRSALINNIRNPDESGIVFYLEFYPVTNNGDQIINHSPTLPVLYDSYACVNKNFIINFSSYDSEGDSLVYKLTDPLQGSAALGNAEPEPSAGPYPPVTWLPGYSATSPMPGLTLDSVTGQISVTPTAQGFYVFAVQCEEYRNQQKIGMSIREFRILVTNCNNLVCITPPAPPIPADLNYSVWPNPFEDKIAVFFESNSVSPFTIQIINSTGAVVKEYKLLSQTDTKYQIEIETGDLSPGLYFSRISNGTIHITKPVSKI
jgi:hypothetical protein